MKAADGFGDGTSRGAGSVPACVVVTHSVGEVSKGQRIDVKSGGLSIGTASCDVAVRGKGTSESRVRLSCSGAPELWLATALGRVWRNGERLASGTMTSGDDIRVEDTYFRFICGDDLQQKFYETIYQITITDFPTGLGNARAFGEAFQSSGRRGKAQIVVAVIGAEPVLNIAMPSQDVLADVVARVVANRPRSWYAARVGELEIGLVVPDEGVQRVEEVLDQWLLDGDADSARLWRGVADVDPTDPVDAALGRARARRRNLSV